MVRRVDVLDRTLKLLGELVDAEPAAIDAALRSCHVRIRVAAALGARADVQAALATLVSLLVRSGLRVEVDVPAVPVATAVLDGSELPAALVAIGQGVIPGSAALPSRQWPELAIVVGEEAPPVATRVVYLGAAGDVASFSPTPMPWSPSDVLVALAAAGLVAGEALRHAVRLLPPKAAWAADVIGPVQRASVRLPGLPAGPVDLGAIDIVSAGAITDAFLWSLKARGGVRGRGRVFDDGTFDATNLNRYNTLDATSAMAGVGKAAHARAQTPDGLLLTPVERRFAESDLPTAAPMIVVGADDIAVRHLAQRAKPMWLGIGATGHFEARVTEHWPGGPCAGCAHPYIEAGGAALAPTCAPISFWAGLILAARILRAATGVRDPGDAYVTFYPLTRPGLVEGGGVPPHAGCLVEATHGVEAA